MSDKLQILIEALLAKTTKQQLIQELKNIEKGLKPIEIKVDTNAEAQTKLFKSLQKIYKEEEKNRLTQEKFSEKALVEKEKQLQYEQKVRKAIDETAIKGKQQVSDMARKLTNEENQNRLKQVTKTQNDIERFITQSNETIAQRNMRSEMLNIDPTQYEQVWKKLLYEQDAKLIKEKKQTSEIQKQIALYKEQLAIKLQNAKTSFGKHFNNEQESAIISKADLITVDNYKNAVKDTNLEYDKQLSKSKTLRKEATLAMKESDTFMKTLVKDFGKMIAWSIVGTALFGTIRQIKQGLDTLKELDTLMVDIAKVTNLTADAMERLVKGSFDAASDYGRTAQDYLKGVAEFSRAGYEEAAKGLSEVSLLAQNVGELTAEQANEFLLATDAAYKYSGSQKELTRVLDGVNEIDNKFATSISKISEGMTVAGSIASNAGIGVNELSAAIGTMTAVTQKSGNEMGRAFRGLVMNLRQIKGDVGDGEIIDDEALSKSAKVLDSVNIKVHEMRNGIEELRNPMDVIEELANKWNTLSTMKQAPIIEALGGKYRGNAVVALLENFNMYEKMLADYANSAGSAIKENEKRMDSWQSKLNQLTNQVSEYWNNAIDSDTVKDIIDLTKEFVGALDNVNQQFGIVTSSVYTLTSLLILFKGQALIGAITKVGGLSAALTALAANPMTWVVIGLGILTGAFIKYADYTQKAKEKTEAINTAYSEFNKSLNSGNIDKVTASLKSLADTVDYEGATKKIAALNDELDRLEGRAVNSRGKFATLSDRQRGKLIAERSELQKQVDMVDNAKKQMEKVLAESTDNALRRRNGTLVTPSTKSGSGGGGGGGGGSTETPDYEKAYQSQYNTIRDLNFELDRQNEILSQKEDLDKIPILLEKNKLLKKQQENLHEINEARRNELSLLKPSSDRYQELVGLIQDTSLEWFKLNSAQSENLKNIDEINKKAQEALDKQNEEARKNLEDVQKQITEVIKKRYEIEKEEAEKAHKDKLEQLEDELDAYKDSVNEQIKEIDKLRDAEDFDKSQQKTTDKITELTNERNTLSMAAQSGDLVAIARIAEIDKDLAEQRENLEELQSDREHELRKENLQDALDSKEKEIKSAKETEEEKYELIKDSYDKLLEEGNLYAEANKALTSGMVTDINGKLVTVAEAFKTFSDQFGQTLGTLGNNIQTEFIDKLNQAQQLINTMSGLPANTGITNTSSVSGLNTSALSSSNLLSGANLSSILSSVSKLSLASLMPMNMPKLSGMVGGGNINIGDIIIQTQSVDTNSIGNITNQIMYNIKREYAKLGGGWKP
jgi:TP901 family phage tail tape measure protein